MLIGRKIRQTKHAKLLLINKTLSTSYLHVLKVFETNRRPNALINEKNVGGYFAIWL